MQVAIVTVGDEILAGDTVNTNASWLAERLHDRGVSVGRITTVPDVVADIARVINEYRAEYDAVVVTGGLGPTHDDVTMEGVAAAVGRDVKPHEEARRWLTEEGGYAAEKLVEGTTDLPARARMLPNEAGVAPGAVVEGIYVLPGVPDEMKAMFEQVAEEFSGERTHSTVVDVDEPESELIDRLRELRRRFDVTVGSYPGESVRIKLTATEERVAEEAAAWLRGQVELVENEE
ncbi:competence/damage-inducible protein A [Halobellus clavatus]|jgi:molybdenum cofactor synthesis domain-containing protein|uniref:Competence/damage-inducible protein cinA n=1 Tax=Halobellus clavatus TaxID=660517 RepID=A0A1H3K3S1_9EURY|nr:molybdopterin-binding protein [Halobellus clavatus]SDY46826.1 competence/damage-inducible protein cinA [Halobellus clavatus]